MEEGCVRGRGQERLQKCVEFEVGFQITFDGEDFNPCVPKPFESSGLLTRHSEKLPREPPSQRTQPQQNTSRASQGYFLILLG